MKRSADAMSSESTTEEDEEEPVRRQSMPFLSSQVNLTAGGLASNASRLRNYATYHAFMMTTYERGMTEFYCGQYLSVVPKGSCRAGHYVLLALRKEPGHNIGEFLGYNRQEDGSMRLDEESELISPHRIVAHRRRDFTVYRERDQATLTAWFERHGRTELHHCLYRRRLLLHSREMREQQDEFRSVVARAIERQLCGSLTPPPPVMVEETVRVKIPHEPRAETYTMGDRTFQTHAEFATYCTGEIRRLERENEALRLQLQTSVESAREPDSLLSFTPEEWDTEVPSLESVL